MAQVPGVIMVGATNADDTRWANSNWGSCLDLFAPGSGITSDDATSDSATQVRSGTGAAAAHVTGAVATLLSQGGSTTMTPAAVRSALLSRMISPGVLTGLDAGSPNRLLYIPPPPVAGGSSIAVARNKDDRLTVFGVNSAGQLFQCTEDTPGGDDWLQWTKSVTEGWYSVAAERDGRGSIGVYGLQKASRLVWERYQTVLTPGFWMQWRGNGGLLNSIAAAARTDGRMEVFGTNDEGEARHASPAPGARIMSWDSFGLAGTVLRSVAADRNAAGLVEVVALASDGTIWHRWQTAATASTYTPWVQMDGSLRAVALARNGDGTLELLGTNAVGQAYHRTGAGQNNWQSWVAFDAPTSVEGLRSIAAETNHAGRVEVFAVGSDGSIWRRLKRVSSAEYAPWIQLGGTLRP
jgi:hypothetical protein